jgi:hypothetical protein
VRRYLFTLVLVLSASMAFSQGLVRPGLSASGSRSGGGTQTLRPTSDADTGAGAFGDCGGTFNTSSAMANAWDAGGTGSFSSLTMNGGSTPRKYRARLFSGWTAGSAVTSLTLKVYSQCTVSLGIQAVAGCSIEYSTNNGTSWSPARSDSSAGWNDIATPFSAILSAAQDLTQVRVRACASATGDVTEPDIASMDIYDIRTEGNP